VVLGGAFFVNGNVNPAAEANIFGDADAADIVFGSAHLYTLSLHALTCACSQLPRCRALLVALILVTLIPNPKCILQAVHASKWWAWT
jgi:Inosine-uridine preferring nucleoside hydrolase